VSVLFPKWGPWRTFLLYPMEHHISLRVCAHPQPLPPPLKTLSFSLPGASLWGGLSLLLLAGAGVSVLPVLVWPQLCQCAWRWDWPCHACPSELQMFLLVRQPEDMSSKGSAGKQFFITCSGLFLLPPRPVSSLYLFRLQTGSLLN